MTNPLSKEAIDQAISTEGRRMAKRLFLAFALITSLVLAVAMLTACGANNTRDQENVKSWDADYSETYTNGDLYPNTTFQCIRGVAIMTTTRGGAGAWHLVPKLDKFCEQFTQHPVDRSQVRKNG